MRIVLRQLIVIYAIIVGMAALWAWYTDVRLLHSPREHLLPDILLAFVSLPTSKSLDPLYDRWPSFFQTPFMELSWLTVSGAFQVLVLWLLSSLVVKSRKPA
jgi:hypothetical protein